MLPAPTEQLRGARPRSEFQPWCPCSMPAAATASARTEPPARVDADRQTRRPSAAPHPRIAGSRTSMRSPASRPAMSTNHRRSNPCRRPANTTSGALSLTQTAADAAARICASPCASRHAPSTASPHAGPPRTPPCILSLPVLPLLLEVKAPLWSDSGWTVTVFACPTAGGFFFCWPAQTTAKRRSQHGRGGVGGAPQSIAHWWRVV